ncbi:uncharacterized protein N7479_010008 [Penicillium vulpinum]|uniref:HNH nuclease domain-containing protein n=1 Tax=Penicillium vulpinum TaxID=29845 RepID=A0A1V6RE06_9EURO|nr:uncharacterized protein N7479_010008 [Penicillium vulpinum]KAJ5951595.1 hypothetical protein N7479_010008 [Penicillium vulpinum]OQE00011.1 hypothetical protein PENVUL_c060G04582 [Penicillium vulpinum]
MSNPPQVPRRAFAVMPKDRQQALLNKQKKEVPTSRSVSDFLESKIKEYRCDLDYIQCAHEGLVEALDTNLISATEFADALQPFMASARTVSHELKTLNLQRKIMEEDLEEQASNKRRRQGEPDVELLERAYVDSIMPKVMSATAQQQKDKELREHHFNASNFKRDVALYYGIPKGMAYCHLSGEWNAHDVKAAHLVPRSLTGDEISHLFGVRKIVLSDTRNALSLHKNLEIALDSGQIVIVPILEENHTTNPEKAPATDPSRWKCVLTDNSKRYQKALASPAKTWLWDEFDGKELKFRNQNRPAKRYLYFRFIITYIFCKKQSNDLFTKKVEAAARDFWPTPGPYLRKSMLRTLARSISGHELPPSLVDGKTFDDSQYVYEEHKTESAMVAAQDIYDAIIASVKTLPPDDESENATTQDPTEEEGYQSSDDDPVYEDTLEFL